MKLSRYGQETIVNYNAGEQTATVCTGDKAVMRKHQLSQAGGNQYRAEGKGRADDD